MNATSWLFLWGCGTKQDQSRRLRWRGNDWTRRFKIAADACLSANKHPVCRLVHNLYRPNRGMIIGRRLVISLAPFPPELTPSKAAGCFS
jgi:hypothetical protein